ncbi:uncharacterized protein [Elaeis guineensis]|uniref:uncharacterized protein isoform X3 n=1 Tax=Elaeis guineensis var. tenera TaxID=51953 RepID=UPI003C6DAB80
MIYRTPKGYFQAERGTMAVMDKYLGTNQVLCDILKSEQSIMRRHQQRKGSTTNDSKQAPRSGAHINQRPVGNSPHFAASLVLLSPCLVGSMEYESRT